MLTDRDPPPGGTGSPAEQSAAAGAPQPAPGPDSLARRMRSAPVVGLVMLAVGLVLGFVARPMIEPRSAPPPAGGPMVGPQNLPRSREEVLPYLLSQTRHFKGDPSAPVTMLVFSDFQCPFCGLYEREVAGQINAHYVATGKVRLGFQHFAFLGPESNWAAEASECASDQNRFWDYHDLLYDQPTGENRGAFNKDNLKRFADALGLNASAFAECLDSGKYANLVISQTQNLQLLGAQSTPTFLINDSPLVGAQNFEAFQQIFEQELSGK